VINLSTHGDLALVLGLGPGCACKGTLFQAPSYLEPMPGRNPPVVVSVFRCVKCDLVIETEGALHRKSYRASAAVWGRRRRPWRPRGGPDRC
jgi:hypothetical protein